MKKFKFFAVAALMIAACQDKEEPVANNDNPVLIDAPAVSDTSAAIQQKKTEPDDVIYIRGTESGALFSEHYIHCYIKPNKMQLSPCLEKSVIQIRFSGGEYDFNGNSALKQYAEENGVSDFMYDGPNSIPSKYVSKSGEIIAVNAAELAELSSENIKMFNALAEQYGDTHFNQNIVPFSEKAVIDTIQSIDIVCNEDFDNAHQKGSALSDITDFYYGSQLEYIKSDYQKMPDIPTQFMKDNGICFSACSEIKNHKTGNMEDTYISFFEPYCFLYFEKLPENPGTYTFEITVKLSQKTLKNTVTIEF